MREKNHSLISFKYLQGVNDEVMYAEDVGICVYFITDGEYVKIGISNSLSLRISHLQIGNPRELKPLHIIPVSDLKEALALEKDLHNYFSKKKVRGEWFSISEKDILTAKTKFQYRLVRPVFRYKLPGS